MSESTYAEFLANLNDSYQGTRAVLTLAFVWFLVDLIRGAPWASTALKAVFASSALTTGLFFYPTLGRHAGENREIILFWGAVFLLSSALGFADIILGRTRVRLPRSGWPLVAVLAFCTAGVGFPAVEWLGGRTYPAFQAFALAPAPYALVVLPLLAVSTRGSLLGVVWLISVFVACADVALVSCLLDLPYWHPAAMLAVIVSLPLALWWPVRGERTP
ncbi:MAG TPA: hypothetical protein PLE60_00165 [Candidatus Latescibacteria bacterium]|nr:hypothetical protein [Candidatus Latescibacterota bacterium]